MRKRGGPCFVLLGLALCLLSSLAFVAVSWGCHTLHTESFVGCRRLKQPVDVWWSDWRVRFVLVVFDCGLI